MLKNEIWITWHVSQRSKHISKDLRVPTFEKMIENAYEKGIEQLELEVVASNQSGLALYKKMGFETWGTFPNKMKYKDGTYADCYWMIKKL